MKALRTISIVALVLTLALANSAQAVDWNYHGTECMTANLAQGELFNWNKDGITNNANQDLFVICPMTYDQDEVAAFASPRGLVQASVFYPGTVPNGQSMQCFIRMFIAQDSGAASSDSQFIVSNTSFSVGQQSFSPSGDNDTDTSPIFNATTSSFGSGHLLCLVPAGGTLRFYSANFFE